MHSPFPKILKVTFAENFVSVEIAYRRETKSLTHNFKSRDSMRREEKPANYDM